MQSILVFVLCCGVAAHGFSLSSALGLGGSAFTSGSGPFGFATSGSVSTDIAQTLNMASFLSGLSNAAGTQMSSAYSSLQQLFANNSAATAAAMASLGNVTAPSANTTNAQQLTRFLSAFQAQLASAANGTASTADQLVKDDIAFKLALANDVIDLVKADIAFKLALINSLVNMNKALYGNATNALMGAIATAQSGLEAAIQGNMGSANATSKAQMQTLLDAIQSADNQTVSAIVAGIATLGGEGVTAQNLLGQMGSSMTGTLQQAVKQTATFLGQIKAGVQDLGITFGAAASGIGSSIASAFGSLAGALGFGSGASTATSGTTGTGPSTAAGASTGGGAAAGISV